MTPDRICRAIVADLRAYATANKGRLTLARDPWHSMAIVQLSPKGFVIAVAWEGDRSSPDDIDVHDQELPDVANVSSPMALCRLGVTVAMAPGPTMEKDLQLLEAIGDRESLAKRTDDICAQLLGLSFASANDDIFPRLRYEDCIPAITPNNEPIAGYTLHFSIPYVKRVGADHPAQIPD